MITAILILWAVSGVVLWVIYLLLMFRNGRMRKSVGIHYIDDDNFCWCQSCEKWKTMPISMKRELIANILYADWLARAGPERVRRLYTQSPIEKKEKS